MSILDAEKAFREAAKLLRGPDDRVLWHMNQGLLYLCGAVKQLQKQIALLDQMIEHVSRQIESR